MNHRRACSLHTLIFIITNFCLALTCHNSLAQTRSQGQNPQILFSSSVTTMRTRPSVLTAMRGDLWKHPTSIDWPRRECVSIGASYLTRSVVPARIRSDREVLACEWLFQQHEQPF